MTGPGSERRRANPGRARLVRRSATQGDKGGALVYTPLVFLAWSKSEVIWARSQDVMYTRRR